MHFSGFAAGLKAAFAAMALLAASPAVAQGDSALGRWMVTASPGTYNNGTSYCTLQNSNTRRSSNSRSWDIAMAVSHLSGSQPISS